jgi:exopolysaccharide biosynthesis protein
VDTRPKTTCVGRRKEGGVFIVTINGRQSVNQVAVQEEGESTAW